MWTWPPSLKRILATCPSTRDLMVTDAFASARPEALTTIGRSRCTTAATETATGGEGASPAICGELDVPREKKKAPITATAATANTSGVVILVVKRVGTLRGGEGASLASGRRLSPVARL